MIRRRFIGMFGALVAISVVAAQALLGTANATVTASVPVAPADKALFFSSDGMRPDLMQKYVNQGSMPAYAQMLADGVHGANGMEQAFPPNTGVGWYSMATGTWPSETGSTNNTFFRTGDTFSNRSSFSGAGVLQADTIANSAERAGKTVAQIDWVGGVPAAIAGPTVDFATFYSSRGVVVPANVPADATAAANFGVNYLVSAPVAASGWTNAPLGDPLSPPMEATFIIPNTTSNGTNVNRTYNLYYFDKLNDGVQKYDTVFMVPNSKNGSLRDARLKVGKFQSIRLTGANGLTGSKAGESAGFHVKLISMASDLSSYKIYFTSIARPQATCSTAACNALPAGVAGENPLEKYIADNLPPWSAADFAAEEAGLIDEGTYVQQGRELEVKYANAVMKFVLGTLQPNTDVALVGYPFTDEVSHQFLGLTEKYDLDGDVNPFYDDANGDGVADGRRAARKGYIKSAYVAADKKLALARKLLDPAAPKSVTTIAASDHGFATQWWAINANKILNDATVFNPSTSTNESLHAGGSGTSNCSALTSDLTKACWAGGTAQIYINPTLPAGLTYSSVRTAVVDAFNSLADPAYPGKRVLQTVLLKEDLRNVQGDDSLHPNRSGDVVVVSRPPYQWDAPTAGVRIAWSHFFGQHGYLPNTVNVARNVNMHATFVAAGPGIVADPTPVPDVRSIDLAPTLAYLMGIPGPLNARGHILLGTTEGGSNVDDITILQVSDWHGQLIPLTENPDTLGSAVFAIGGAAFLKPWFDWYENDANGDTYRMSAGDTIGATPPISSSFGDEPAINAMNGMGIDIDGIGNHNFDAGQAHFRNDLIPLANFPFVSSNVVDGGTNNPPAEWTRSHVFTTSAGTKIGFIGFSNDDLPSLTSPAAVSPFVVQDALTNTNAESANLTGQGVDVQVAMGHMGATGGTLTAPNGPGITLADGVSPAIDAVLGDHTDVEAVSKRPNGVMYSEARSKGLRFNRTQVLVDTTTGQVIYTTADWHKPWDIGVTPDPALQNYIDQLNAQLAPILNTVIGHSDVAIPRADSCAHPTGRACESLVGDIITDGMRNTYGVDFAITNSGGIRADLTCPRGANPGDPDPNPNDFCPANNPPDPYVITRGQNQTVLPFGNQVVTATISGAQLKAMLENGVSLQPSAPFGQGPQGRFPQVSGLCFTWEITAASGSRITSVTRQLPGGSCAGAAVGLTAGDGPYTIAENDFMMNGGDGYPNFAAIGTTRDLMESVNAAWVTANDPLAPVIQGRITCTDSNGPTAPNCPF